LHGFLCSGNKNRAKNSTSDPNCKFSKKICFFVLILQGRPPGIATAIVQNKRRGGRYDTSKTGYGLVFIIVFTLNFLNQYGQ